MISRFNKPAKSRGFSLLEVLITAGILTTVVTFIFRGLMSTLSSVKFSQNLTLACLLTETKLFEIEQLQRLPAGLPASDSGSEKLQEKEFSWNYEITDSLDTSLKELKELKFSLLWQEDRKRKPEYTLNTYLATRP